MGCEMEVETSSTELDATKEIRSEKDRVMCILEEGDLVIYKDNIGSGAFASIYKAEYKHEECAAKVLHQHALNMMIGASSSGGQVQNAAKDSILQECDFLQKLQHENVIQHITNALEPKTGLPILIMELMECNLGVFIVNHRPLDLMLQLTICHAVSSGLHYLHCNGIIHRDMCDDNILLRNGQKLVVKISDFGMSTLLNYESMSATMTAVGHRKGYLPPEGIGFDSSSESDEEEYKVRYSHHLDIYSLGAVATQTVQSADQFKSRRELKRTFKKIVVGHPLKSIIAECIEKDSKQRPQACDVINKITAILSDSDTRNWQSLEEDISIGACKHAWSSSLTDSAYSSHFSASSDSSTSKTFSCSCSSLSRNSTWSWMLPILEERRPFATTLEACLHDNNDLCHEEQVGADCCAKTEEVEKQVKTEKTAVNTWAEKMEQMEVRDVPKLENIQEHSSYHNSLSREEAEQRLELFCKFKGCTYSYLTRFSSTSDCYVLSVHKCREPQELTLHFNIIHHGKKVCKLEGKSPVFSNIDHLLRYYQGHSIDSALKMIGVDCTKLELEQALDNDQEAVVTREEECHEIYEHRSYHKHITGEEAEIRLKRFCWYKKCKYCYLTRYSSNFKCYILSVYKKRKSQSILVDLKIELLQERGYKIKGISQEFKDIGALLKYYEIDRIHPILRNIGFSCTEHDYAIAQESNDMDQLVEEERRYRRNLGSKCNVQ